jgi:hypothetical protein
MRAEAAGHRDRDQLVRDHERALAELIDQRDRARGGAREADMVHATGVLGPWITARMASPAKAGGRRALRPALDGVLGRSRDLSLGR